MLLQAAEYPHPRTSEVTDQLLYTQKFTTFFPPVTRLKTSVWQGRAPCRHPLCLVTKHKPGTLYALLISGPSPYRGEGWWLWSFISMINWDYFPLKTLWPSRIFASGFWGTAPPPFPQIASILIKSHFIFCQHLRVVIFKVASMWTWFVKKALGRSALMGSASAWIHYVVLVKRLIKGGEPLLKECFMEWLTPPEGTQGNMSTYLKGTRCKSDKIR